MAVKAEQLQIRVTAREKAALKRRAKAAGLDLSAYVLACALPPDTDRFAELLRAVSNDGHRRFALAELADWLAALAPAEFAAAVKTGDPRALDPVVQNYVAAMIEQAARGKGVTPPAWVRDIAPLETPHFATTLRSLRPHLLRVSPLAFKRRNIFVDPGSAGRV